VFKHLYDCFAHWYHGGTIYFYSDPHFADPEMKGIRKGYIPDEEQIQRIRAKVGKNDTLIILGDIGDKEWLKKLRGYKVLILGNHDVGATTYQEYADEVYEGALMISDKLILSHEPIDFPYALNIHGHCHALPHKYDDKHLNMCAEAIGYTPVPIKAIVEGGYLKSVVSIHRETIDTATERKQKRLAKKSHI
jgi:calcineurin-like phosphoesterase family protein